MFLQHLNFHQQLSPDTLPLRSHCSGCSYWTCNRIAKLLPEISERPVKAQVGREVPTQTQNRCSVTSARQMSLLFTWVAEEFDFQRKQLRSPNVFFLLRMMPGSSKSEQTSGVVRINIRNPLKPISCIPWKCNSPLTSLKIPVYQTLASHSEDCQLISHQGSQKSGYYSW